MRRSELPGRDWPEPPQEGADAPPPYAPETLLIPDAHPSPSDDRVQGLVTRLPAGSGALRRVGICNASGVIYREVFLHGPVQLLYFWAGLNGMGFRQRSDERGYSRYWRLFVRDEPEGPPRDGDGVAPIRVDKDDSAAPKGTPLPQQPVG